MNVKCPDCGRPADPAFRPFCSRGCQDRDLLRWLDEGYCIPAGPADPDGLDKPRDPD